MDYELIEEIEELMENEKYNEAINKIEGLDNDEYDTQLSITLAHAYSCLGNDKKAVKILFDIADEVDDDDILYHFELGSCLYGINKYDDAINEVNKCLDIDNRFIDAWILLCYIYFETGKIEDMEYASKRAQEIDPDLWEEYFEKNNNIDISYYFEQDTKRILKHIEKYYGAYCEIIDYDKNYCIPTMIAVVPPTPEKNYYKLITIGIGAYKANVPEDLENFNINRIELVAYLPADLDLKGKSFNDLWITKYMKTLGNMMAYEDTWLGFGHTISNGDTFADDTQFNGVILDFVHNVDDSAIECELSNGDIVTFYQLVPLYEEEMLYKINNGCEALFELLYQNKKDQYIGIIDIKRPNLCADTLEKKWAIPRSSIEQIIIWSGGDGCFATDRIMVDNKKVGYMYRENPKNEYDSGWRFLAGDESQEYVNNSKNTGIYSLNTVCNYDNDIIALLDSPVGSAFYRNKKNKFIQDRNFHCGEASAEDFHS